MKYKILTILCVLCVLSGCRVELPPQSAAGQATSAVNSQEVSQDESGSEASAMVPSVPESAAVSASTPVSPAPSKANTSGPAAASKPAASKPSASGTAKEQSCTLLISCGDILKSRDKFSADQLSIVPEDGVIYSEKTIAIKSGDTVFDVLLRETKADKIQMEFVASPVYQTNYIKSIDNIYEKAFGSTSGWMYTVNSKQPPVAASGYKLKNGDKIQWLYVCGQ
nr:DUF4430 domain-containing protein [uncultured Caproiciproducens sp.]